MLETGAPEILWDYCLEWCALIRSHTALNIASLDGKTPAAKITGDTPDISHLAEFGWYDWVWYHDPVSSSNSSQDDLDRHSMQNLKLGRYLGPADNVGGAMCGMVLTEKSQVLDRTTIHPLSPAEKNSEVVQKMRSIYGSVLAAKLKHRVAAMDEGMSPEEIDAELEKSQREEVTGPVTPDFVPYEPWDPSELGYLVPSRNAEDDDPEDGKPIADADDIDYNAYVSAKVMLPRGGHTFACGKVIGRSRDENGELIGKSNPNPLLDTSYLDVELEDGSVERYSANIIAEHI